MRNPGTIMGVAQDGRFAGSLSGGCIENAVVAEALEVLKEGKSRIVRFGAGSRYLDIRLPCGGGLDLLFQPLADGSLAEACLTAIAARQPFSIASDGDRAKLVVDWRKPAFDPQTKTAVFGHWPEPLLQIIGHGAGVEALAMLARTNGCSTRILTPDTRIVEQLAASEVDATLLERTSQTDALRSDPWTATIFLFHDHDWEIELMERALAMPHFYIGAMGGRRAHDVRCEALRERGVDNVQMASIRAPVGLFHSSRDPQTLALSTLAEVVRTYEETDFAGQYG